MTGGAGQRFPWREGHVVSVVVTAMAGLVGIAAGWLGAGGTASPAQQVAWLNLGIAGFTIFAVGNCLWLLRIRKAVGERRHALISFQADEYEPSAQGPAAGRDRPSSAQTSVLDLVRAPGMTRVHDRDCPMVEGKAVQPAVPADGEPCGVCVA